MTESDQLQLIRTLRGAPATIILLLLLRPGSLTNRELCLFTGYTDKTITEAMQLLDRLQLTQYNGRQYGWSLNARQLHLPLDDLSTAQPQPVDKQIGIIPISPSSSSSFSNKEEGKKKGGKMAVDRNISDLGTDTDRKIYDLLRAAGISPRSPKGREIIAAGLQPEYVAAHVTAWQAEGKPVGWLITRLLAGDPPPPIKNAATIPAQYADIIMH